MIVTVTLNAAIDRTLTVPNFQRGQRHRASAGVTLAGGKGINVARALKALGVPVVATGLVGGATGTRIVEELTAEAILNDFVRIEGESRTSTAVVDPTGETYTEINEWGPVVSAEAREGRGFGGVAPGLEPVSTVGSGDALLGAYLAARHVGRTHEEALRAAVATGAASTLEVGAGRFDPRQAGRLQAGVVVSQLRALEAA